MNIHVLFINFVFVLLKFVDWKNSAIVNVSVSDSDILLCLMNISHNVGYLYFVLGVLWENFANKGFQMVFTERRHQAIISGNMVEKLAGICVDISQKCCVHTVGYMKQGV